MAASFTNTLQRGFRRAAAALVVLAAVAGATVPLTAATQADAPGSAATEPAPPPLPPTPPSPRPAPARSFAPSPGDEAVLAGLEALKTGDIPGARKHFEMALGLDPNHQVARARMAYLKFRAGDYPGASVDADAAVKLDPADSLAFVVLGRAREATGDVTGALSAYTQAVALEGSQDTQERLVATALAHYLRAMVRIEKGDRTDVESDLRAALTMYTKHAYAEYELALLLLQTDRAAEAVEAFDTAAELAPGFKPQEGWLYPSRRYLFLDNNIRYWKAMALRKAGKPAEALAAIEPLLSTVESMAGSTLTASGGAVATALAGKVETSFYNAHYEAALACEAKGDKSRAQSLLKTLLKVALADPQTQKQAKDLQKRLKS